MGGLIGRKVGMTSVFDEVGNNIPCTLVEVTPNVVTQVKSTDGADGYDAVQLAAVERKTGRVTRARRGHYERAGTSPKQKLVEFRRDFAGQEVSLGDEIAVDDVFEEGDIVDVVGISKGKGFQGVVRGTVSRGSAHARTGSTIGSVLQGLLAPPPILPACFPA